MSSWIAERLRARRGRAATSAALAAVVLVALVPLGRWEDRRNVDAQLRGMRHVAGLIGPLDSRTLVGFRVLPAFDCLVYRRGANLYALELCVDSSGRVVEAIDRRDPSHRLYWTLRNEQSVSTLRVDRAEVNRLLRKMGAPTSSASTA